MKLTLTFAIIVLTGFCSFAQIRGATALSNPEIPEGNTYAIVIGISKYKNLPPLQYADRDAQSFYDYLVSSEGMHVDSSNVSLFINEAANINNLGNSVSDVLQKDIKKGDKVFFFFAGHGDYDAKIMRDQSLLLLQGAPNGNYFQNVFSGDYISTSDLHIKFTSELIKRGAEVMLIIDACHSGGMNSQLAGGEQGGIITSNALNTIQSTVKLYSCQASQYSLESTQFGGGRGLFSFVLMEGLYGMADANNDKAVSMKELQRYLEDNVPMLALPNRQDPVVKTEDNTLVVAMVNDNLLREYKMAKERNMSFLLAANIKGNEEAWIAAMSITQKELYQNCKQQIKVKNLNEAYLIYKKYELEDKTSEASILLRRNLSAALQEGAAVILTPMLEDVSKFNADLGVVAQARDYLDKAAELLGKDHFLYDKLQARKLFLKTLVIILKAEDKKRSKECIQYLEESVTLEPNAPYSYYYLSSLYSTEKRITDAENAIKKYLDLIPTSCWAHNNYGNLLLYKNNYSEAEKEYKKAIEIDPSFATPHYNYAISLERSQRIQEAIIEYKKAIELYPDYADAHHNLSILLSGLNLYDEAETEYKKSIELDPANVSSYYNYGIFLIQQKRNDEAEIQYQKALILNPDDEKALYSYAILLVNFKRYDEAEKKYKKIIRIKPDYALTYTGYGYMLNLLERYTEAVQVYAKAIELNPNDADLHTSYGFNLLKAGKPEESEIEYKKALELDPGNVIAHNNYSLLLYDLKRYKEAEEQNKKAIELNPASADAYINYGYLLYNLERYQESISAYRKSSVCNSDTSSVYKWIAFIYYTNLKQYDSSAYYYQKVFRNDKNDTSSLEKYAYSLLRLNKIPESIKAFETETERFPDYPWGYYNLCCVYSLQNEKGNALPYFNKSLQKGMELPEHWQIDTDLDNIRTMPEFKTILLKYYSQDELDKYPTLFVVQKK